jgi:hypothetical protein
MGFQGYAADEPGVASHAAALAHLGAFTREPLVDEVNATAALLRVVGEVLGPGSCDMRAGERLASAAADARAELVYEFSVWEDRVADVLERLLDIFDAALVEEFGTRWRKLALGDDLLSVGVRTRDSRVDSSSASSFNLTPVLKQPADPQATSQRGRRLKCKDVLSRKLPEQHAVLGFDRSGFVSFTAQLESVHEDCDPGAFGGREGGTGATASLKGLQSQPQLNGMRVIVLGPVDLEKRRWPVKLVDSKKTMSVKRSNLLPL